MHACVSACERVRERACVRERVCAQVCVACVFTSEQDSPHVLLKRRGPTGRAVVLLSADGVNHQSIIWGGGVYRCTVFRTPSGTMDESKLQGTGPVHKQETPLSLVKQGEDKAETRILSRYPCEGPLGLTAHSHTQT